jgi:hypothetical protein
MVVRGGRALLVRQMSFAGLGRLGGAGVQGDR